MAAGLRMRTAARAGPQIEQRQRLNRVDSYLHSRWMLLPLLSHFFCLKERKKLVLIKTLKCRTPVCSRWIRRTIRWATSSERKKLTWPANSWTSNYLISYLITDQMFWSIMSVLEVWTIAREYGWVSLDSASWSIFKSAQSMNEG